MLKLYHAVPSVCSIKVRVALAEIGLDYEEQSLDLQKGDQFAPDYMALNPSAVVPTLVDDGLVVVESSLIIEYLDRRYNGSTLMPEGLEDGVATRHWLLRCLAIHAAINTLSFSTVMRKRQLAAKTQEEIEASLAQMPDPVARTKRLDLFAKGLNSGYVDQALKHLGQAFQDMDKALARGDWVSGPAFGLADIALISYVDRLDRLGLDNMWDSTPSVDGWLRRMQSRDSYKAEVSGRIPEKFADGMKADGSAFRDEVKARQTALS